MFDFLENPLKSLTIRFIVSSLSSIVAPFFPPFLFSSKFGWNGWDERQESPIFFVQCLFFFVQCLTDFLLIIQNVRKWDIAKERPIDTRPFINYMNEKVYLFSSSENIHVHMHVCVYFKWICNYALSYCMHKGLSLEEKWRAPE